MPFSLELIFMAKFCYRLCRKFNAMVLVKQADPAQALNVPVVPLGAMLSAAYPLSSRPPYVLSWLNHLISAEDMMHPELLEKLVLNNFCKLNASALQWEIDNMCFSWKLPAASAIGIKTPICLVMLASRFGTFGTGQRVGEKKIWLPWKD